MRKIKAFKISLRHIFPCFFNKGSHIFTVIWAHTFCGQLWRENVCDEASEWGVNRSRKTLRSRWRSMTSFQGQPEQLRYLQWAVLGGQSDTSKMFVPHSPHYHSTRQQMTRPEGTNPQATQCPMANQMLSQKIWTKESMAESGNQPAKWRAQNEGSQKPAVTPSNLCWVLCFPIWMLSLSLSPFLGPDLGWLQPAVVWSRPSVPWPNWGQVTEVRARNPSH